MIGKFHGYFGYLVVLGSQFTLATGVCNFYFYENKDSLAWTLVAVNISLFVVMLVIGEITYRMNLSREDAFNKVQSGMTIDQFEKHIK